MIKLVPFWIVVINYLHININTVYSQDKEKLIYRGHNIDSIAQTIDMLTFDFKSAFNDEVNQYADSLNDLDKDAFLPEFLTKRFENLEVGFYVYVGTHDHNTFRESLFKKINNIFTLQKIIKSSEKSFDKIDFRTFEHASFSLPYSRFTLRQLAKKRLKEIKRQVKELKSGWDVPHPPQLRGSAS